LLETADFSKTAGDIVASSLNSNVHAQLNVHIVSTTIFQWVPRDDKCKWVAHRVLWDTLHPLTLTTMQQKFYRLDALLDAQPTASAALAYTLDYNLYLKLRPL